MTACIRRAHSVWPTCPCPDCTVVRRRMAKLARNGAYRRVTSDAAWEVVDDLIERGWSAQAIATSAGMSWKGVQEALTTRRRTGERRLFGPSTAARIVNHGDPLAGSVGIDGTRRRLRGLARQGWDLQRLSNMSGINFSTLAAARNSPTEHCRVWVYLHVRELTARIGMEVGPSTIAAECAEKHGWPGVLAWDDIDNPQDRPSGGPRRSGGRGPFKETEGHVITCPRCGLRRQGNDSRGDATCRDCKSVEKVA